MVACSVRTKDGTIRDWKEQSTFCKKLDARRAAARIQFEERMGGDGWRVGASFLHRIGRLFTLTLKPRKADFLVWEEGVPVHKFMYMQMS